MQHGRPTLVRWLVIALALASLLLTAASTAQDDPAAADPEALPELLAASTAPFTAYGAPEVYESLRRMVSEERALAQELIQALRDGTRWPAPEHELCAFLAGNGGNPRVDGGAGTGRVDGGGLLQSLVAPFSQDDLDKAWLGSLAWQQGPLALAIIDAFDVPWLVDVAALAPTSADANDVWSELVRDWTIARAEPSPDGQDWVVPHGHLVLYHALRVLSFREVDEAHVLWQPMGDGHVRLELTLGEVQHVIDLFHLEFDGLDGLVEALGTVHTDDFTDHQVVMSWGISDCAVVASYEAAAASGGASLSYLVHLHALVESAVGRDLVETLCEAFLPHLPGDLECDDAFATVVALVELDLRAADHVDWPEDQVAGGLTRLFASAGNQALPFPMPPAAWPGVMGVAACSPSEPAMAWFSNRGDYLPWEHVVAPGAWFASNLGGAFDVRAGYWGTSFAAPYAAIHARHAIAAGATGPHSLPPCQGPIPADEP